jgi:hypothetical protein
MCSLHHSRWVVTVDYLYLNALHAPVTLRGDSMLYCVRKLIVSQGCVECGKSVVSPSVLSVCAFVITRAMTSTMPG